MNKAMSRTAAPPRPRHRPPPRPDTRRPAAPPPRPPARSRTRTAARPDPAPTPPAAAVRQPRPTDLFAERLLAVLSGQRPVHWMLRHTAGRAYDDLAHLAALGPLRTRGGR